MPTMTTDRISEILGQLNDYEARDWDSSYEGHAIWRDVIERLPEYDATATNLIEGQGGLITTQFIAGDTRFVYSMQDSHWFTEAA
jgi:hypothetical protein